MLALARRLGFSVSRSGIVSKFNLDLQRQS
jgi:hypothetical protein